jgi:hypothetical protein
MTLKVANPKPKLWLRAVLLHSSLLCLRNHQPHMQLATLHSLMMIQRCHPCCNLNQLHQVQVHCEVIQLRVERKDALYIPV